jgi:hypothetical protein
MLVYSGTVSLSRLRVVAALAALLYAFVAETSDLRHHDFACSPKASSQCEACARGPEVSRVATGFHVDEPALHLVGDVFVSLDASPRAGRTLPRVGRAPPA